MVAPPVGVWPRVDGTVKVLACEALALVCTAPGCHFMRPPTLANAMPYRDPFQR